MDLVGGCHNHPGANSPFWPGPLRKKANMRTRSDTLAFSRDSMGTCRVPRSYAERPVFVKRGGCRSVPSVAAFPPKEGLGEANLFSFNPAVEEIHLPPSTAPNRRRRRQRQAPQERDASPIVPPRAPEVERLSTPDFDPPTSPSSPSQLSGQPFCACCTGSEPHACPSSRQIKLETQSQYQPFPS